MTVSGILKNKKPEYFYSDLTAAILWISLIVFLLITARYTVGIADEAFYYTIPQRLLQGDKLITDEWALSQFVFLLNVPPYWAYTRITGGTEGIILFMRIYFVLINGFYYCFMYKKLRRFKFAGVAATFLFCAIIPQTTLSIAYFSVASMALMAVFLLIVFDEKPKSRAVQILAGAILAIGVMAEPLLIIAFGVWFLFVVIRAVQKKRNKPFFEVYGFLLDKTQFLFITAGAVIVFAFFMWFLIAKGSFRDLSDILPYLFSGKEYNTSNIIDLRKLKDAITYFGPVFLLGLFLCLLAAFIFSHKKKKNLAALDFILVTGLICLAMCYIHGAIKSASAAGVARYKYFYQAHGVPLLLFSPIPFLLSEKPKPRFSAVCIGGIMCSVCIDVSSDVMLSSCAKITLTGLIFGFIQFLEERCTADAKNSGTVFRRKNTRRINQFKKTVISICLAIFFLWEGAYVLAEGLYKPPEKPLLQSDEPLACTLEAGPFRHLKTISSIQTMYYASLRDLDQLKQLSDGAPVTVLNNVSFMYLYLDLPYATFSAWYEDEPERLSHYWQLNPAHRPTYIYLPFYDTRYYRRMDERELSILLSQLFNYIDGETTEGEMGYIIRVTRLLPDKTF